LLGHVSSSSSSGGTPSGEHSHLHNWTPFGTILCAKPRRVKAKVGRLQVRLDGTEPGLTWSASPAAPVRWKTVDGCLKGTGMILWWISLDGLLDMSGYGKGPKWVRYHGMVEFSITFHIVENKRNITLRKCAKKIRQVSVNRDRFKRSLSN